MDLHRPLMRPKALLFDIGGVCVMSPFQAIVQHERAHGIPAGWINTAIAAAAPDGAWQRLERGEVPLDNAFFDAFAADLAAVRPWARFQERTGACHGDDGQPPPSVDARSLFWEMMRLSRTPDPYVWPAVRKLRDLSREKEEGRSFVVGALSNTVVFPDQVEDEQGDVFESGLRGELGRTNMGDLRAAFDVFVSSAHVGLRKPDPRIYELAIRLLDAEARRRGVTGSVQAGDVLFLDDIGQNLRAAHDVGMKTLKVELGKSREAVEVLERVMGLSLLDEKVRL